MEMRKIKVVMIGPYLYTQSGVRTHIRKLARYLSQREDIELHLIGIGNKNKKFKKGNINVHEIKKLLPYPFSIPSLVWFVKHKIIEIDPDIIHAEGTMIIYSTTVALLRNRYPTLLTILGIFMKQLKFWSGFDFIFVRLFYIAKKFAWVFT